MIKPIIIACLFLYALCEKASPHPQGLSIIQAMGDINLQLNPGVLDQRNFNDKIFDIISLQLEKLESNGQWIEVALANSPNFQHQGKFGLNGCSPLQGSSQLMIQGQRTIYRHLKQDENLVTATYFKNLKIFLLITSFYNVYQVSFLSFSSLEDSMIMGTFNFEKLLETYQSPIPNWVVSLRVKEDCYILTRTDAFVFPSTSISLDNLKRLTGFKFRNKIFDFFVDEDKFLWIAAGEEGVDLYQINDQAELELITTYDNKENSSVEGIKIVNQGQRTLLLFLTIDEGVNVFQLFKKYSKIEHKYFIPIPNISSMDAFAHTLAVVLSSRTIQSGLEIFFDSSNYYINYFQRDEISIDKVLLHHSTNTALWIGEEISIVYQRSRYYQHLKHYLGAYEQHIQMKGTTSLIFFSDEENQRNYLFSMGSNGYQFFKIDQFESRVMCQSQQGGLSQKYRIILTSSYCEKSLGEEQIEKANYLFNSCTVFLNLNFGTNEAILDSSNIIKVIGILIGLLLIFILTIVTLTLRWRKNNQKLKGYSNFYDNIKSQQTVQTENPQQQEQQQE